MTSSVHPNWELPQTDNLPWRSNDLLAENLQVGSDEHPEPTCLSASVNSDLEEWFFDQCKIGVHAQWRLKVRIASADLWPQEIFPPSNENACEWSKRARAWACLKALQFQYRTEVWRTRVLTLVWWGSTLVIAFHALPDHQFWSYCFVCHSFSSQATYQTMALTSIPLSLSLSYLSIWLSYTHSYTH